MARRESVHWSPSEEEEWVLRVTGGEKREARRRERFGCNA